MLHVAVAIITNAQAEVLIAQRPPHAFQGGYWEFPGGKVEESESVFAALVREIAEEVGVKIVAAEPFMQVTHDYPERQVLLDVWRVTAYAGQAYGAEGQKVQWVSQQALSNFSFPEANQGIVAAIQHATTMLGKQ
jgi:8-oxo-dGTP diphosphatase